MESRTFSQLQQVVTLLQHATILLQQIVTAAPIFSLSKVLRGHGNSVTSVSFSPNGSRIVSGSDDRTVRLWDAQGAALAA